MANSLIAQHLSEKNPSLSLTKAITKLLQNSNNSVIHSILSKTPTLKVKPNQKSENIQSFIENSLKTHPDIENNIRKAKLIEAERQRQELQNKLNFIKDSISDLKTAQSPTPKKPNLMDKEARKEFFETEKKKTEEVASKIKKFKEHQKQIKIELEKQIEKLNKKIEKQKETEELNEKCLVQLKEERIKEQKAKTKEKRLKRLEELEKLKKTTSEKYLFLNTKPLYLKIQEKFEKEVEMPEFEKRKEELKRKRLLFSPIQHEKLQEHIQ